MSGLQPLKYLQHDAGRLRGLQLASLREHAGELPALDKLHADELQAIGNAEIVNAHHVAMSDLTCEDQFLFEPAQYLRIIGELRPDDLNSDDSIDFEIARLIYGPHAAFTERFENLVSSSKDPARNELSRPGGSVRMLQPVRGLILRLRVNRGIHCCHGRLVSPGGEIRFRFGI